MATRLSYRLWASLPDKALTEAAARGELSTRDQIAAQVDRMLADPRALDGFMTFASQWQRLQERRLSGHTIVVGDTPIAEAMVDGLRRAGRAVLWTAAGDAR